MDGIGGAEDGGDDRNDVHQRHADHPEHVSPAQLERLNDGGSRNVPVLVFLGEGRCFIDFAADDVAGDDDEEAEQERYPPAPAVECFGWHVGCERQEDRRCKDLAGLNPLESKAGIESAPPERGMLEDHRTGSGDFSGNRKALDQAQDNEKHRRQHADLLICRQEADEHRRDAHQEHADDQNRLAAMGISPVSENEGADRPGNIAHAVGRQRCNDRDGRIFRWKEDLRKDQRRRCGVDKEVVIFERRSDPAAGGGLLRLTRIVVACAIELATCSSK